MNSQILQERVASKGIMPLKLRETDEAGHIDMAGMLESALKRFLRHNYDFGLVTNCVSQPHIGTGSRL